MEETLHQRLIGQDEAVKAVSKAIRRARVGLKNPNRPIASFIFSGPTGVGKTELCKTLARYCLHSFVYIPHLTLGMMYTATYLIWPSYLFDDEEALIRIDMTEYMEPHSVSRLCGSPPGAVPIMI